MSRIVSTNELNGEYKNALKSLYKPRRMRKMWMKSTRLRTERRTIVIFDVLHHYGQIADITGMDASLKKESLKLYFIIMKPNYTLELHQNLCMPE